MSWFAEAACIGKTWMTERGHAPEARKVCKGCPVLAECRNWALHDPEAIGIPGILAGLSPEQRGQVECVGCGAIVLKDVIRQGRCPVCQHTVAVA